MIQLETKRLIIKTNLNIKDGNISIIEPSEINILDLKPPKIEDSGFALYLKDSGELVGHIGLRFDRRPFELTIGIEDEYKENKYMSEAHPVVVEWLLNECKIDTICALVGSLTPKACEKILKRDGFIQEGPDVQGWWSKKRDSAI